MKVKWTRLALQDLISLHNYIEEENPSSARAMVQRIHESVAHLIKFPQMGKEGRVSGTRELVIVHSPYIVVYRFQKQEVQIISIIHSSMRWPDSFPEEG
jgi:addiction module RelE/StbE family toxin